MTHALPTGFYLCLLGVAACGGLALRIAWGWVRNSRALARARLVPADERGSSAVEFPFAFIYFVIFTVFTWQLAFLCSAYLVVDYAAYAAVRSAIVVVPQDRASEGKDEGENKVADVTCGLGSGKGGDLREAAAFVIYPVAGNYGSASAWTGTVPLIGDVSSILPSDALAKLGQELDIVTRYVYALLNTQVRLVIDTSDKKHEFNGGDLLTVEVKHDYSLRVPFADRILGHLKFPAGYVTEIAVTASMVNEGFGPEAKPEGAPDDSSGGGGAP